MAATLRRVSARIRLSTIGAGAAGWGSVAAKIPVFTVVDDDGTDLLILQSNSAAQGAVILVNVPGWHYVHSIHSYDTGVVTDSRHTLVVNDTDTTAAITATPFVGEIDRIIVGAGTFRLSALVYLNAGDLVRGHGQGTGQLNNAVWSLEVLRA